MQFLRQVHHLKVEIERTDHVDGIAGVQLVEDRIDRRVVVRRRAGTATARERAQPLDAFERSRTRVRAQNVADEPAEERDARAKRGRGVSFDGPVIRGCDGVSSCVVEGGYMIEVLDTIERWKAEGQRIAVATVVAVEQSAPRDPGAVMTVNERGDVAGSVSGGCVESAVYEEAQDAIATGRPRLVTYGISDEDAISVGLTCGGTIHVFVERLDW
jgi:xanthine dehydrogenase accessory factor